MDKKLLIDEYLQGKHPIEGKKWELPTADELDRDEALFDALIAEKKQTSRFTKTIGRTLLAIAAVLIAVVALFTWKNFKSGNQPQLAEKTEEIAPQEDTTKVIEKDNVVKSPTTHVMIANDTRYDDQHNTSRLKSSQPKKKNQKAVKPQEPMITEAEPLPEEPETEQEYLPTEEDPFLLAAAFSQDIRSRGEHLYQEVAQMINNQ